MKIIEPSVENITPSKYDIESIYKHIEKCARTCYKSTDKITDDSYKKFCEMLKTNKHLSTYEHGTVYLIMNGYSVYHNFEVHKYTLNPYSKVNYDEDDDKSYITSNLRVLIENGWEDDLAYLCEPTEYHEKRYTFKVICDRAVSHEWVRHRHLSFSQESQRYCNYSKDKYGNEITVIRPHWINKEELDKYGEFHIKDRSHTPESCWKASLNNAEQGYFYLLDKGVKPQDARAVLPNSCKTELIVTGFESDWKHFLSLRSSKAGATGAHPDIVYLANKIHDILTENEMAI